MTTRLSKISVSKKIVAATLVGFALVGTSAIRQNISADLKAVGVVESGVQTCFQRVNQSYTAKLISDSASNYLTKDFTGITEECFSDVIEHLQDKFETKLGGAVKLVNALASDVHWFHDRLLGNGSKFSEKETAGNVLISNIGGRFEKLENKLDKVAISLDGHKRNIKDSSRFVGISYYLLAIMLPFLLIWEYSSQRRRRTNNREVETDAFEEIESNVFDNQKIEGIIKRALDNNEMLYCSQLFSKYYTYNRQNQTTGLQGEYGQLYQFATSDDKRNEQKFDQIWNESVKTEENLLDRVAKEDTLDKVKLNLAIANVVDLFSKKILELGIDLKFDIEETAHILGEREGVEQILYHAISHGINSCQAIKGKNQRIDISTRILGGSILVEIKDNGIGFSDEAIQVQDGLVRGQIEDHLGLELLISKEFIEEFNGSINLKNNQSEDEADFGGTTQLIFRRAHVAREIAPKANGKRVVQLVKGKKKDILAQMM